MIALLIRDLRLTFRSGGGFGLGLAFFLLVAVLVPLGVGPEGETLGKIAAGILWVGALLACLLSLDRIFALDFEDGWDRPMSAEVDRLFGDTPLARWTHAETLYARAGAHARFELAPGIGHDRKALQDRSTAFFRRELAAPR